MRHRHSRPARPTTAFQHVLREAMPRLAAQWDGGVERVALLVEGKPPRFIGRAEAIERVLGRGANYDAAGAVAARSALAGGPGPNQVDCVVEGWSSGGVLRIGVRDFQRYLSGDFESSAPGASAEMAKAVADTEVAAALIQVTAERLPDPNMPALMDVADALFDRPSDVEGILSLVRESIVACRPLYGTAAGQNMGIVLNAIGRATAARGGSVDWNAGVARPEVASAPPIEAAVSSKSEGGGAAVETPPRRPATTLPKLTGEEHFADALEAARYPLSLGWDGTFERVAFVEPAGATVAVHYVSRDTAVRRMFELASKAPNSKIAAACRTEATMIAQGPRPNRVDCVILGWGGQALIYLNPDVLRATALEFEEDDDEERRALLTGPLDVERMRRFLSGRGLVSAGSCDDETVIASWHKGRSAARGLVDDDARRESIAWLEKRGYSHFADDLRPRTGKEN